MGKLNYLDITYIKINDKEIYIDSNKNIHIVDKKLNKLSVKKKL